MRHVWTIALVVGAAVIGPLPAAAQVAFPAPGARVRVSAPELEIKEDAGKLLRATTDSLTIDFAGRVGERTIPIDGLSRLEVSTGKRRGAGFGYGAALGIVVGLVAGVAVGAVMVSECQGELCGIEYIITVPGGAVLGFIVGGITGVARAPDRWEEVPLRRLNELEGFGVVRATRLGLSIAF